MSHDIYTRTWLVQFLEIEVLRRGQEPVRRE